MGEQYLVSARKYRPSSFDAVVGQEALTTTLKHAISSGKLAHAYLFCGPRGVGKTTCARIFAKNINCMNPHDGEACGECESCKSFDEGRSFNIYELDAASNNSVDDIRSITEQVQVPPQIGKYKVYIIDEVHMLSTAAFNAFLKTLEEPPSYAIFILATTEKHKLLPTILSRCQIYDFNRMEIADIVNHLKKVAEKENITYEPEALNVIARKADGGMRDALSIFDQVTSYCNGNITYQGAISNLNILDYEYYFMVADYILEKNVPQLLLVFDEILRKGFDGGVFIAGLTDHFRDLLVSRDTVTLPLLQVSEDVRARYSEQAMKYSPALIYKAMKIANDCSLAYKASRNKKLQVELALIMMAQLDENGEEVSSGRSPKRLKPLFAAYAQQVVMRKPDVAPHNVEEKRVAAATVQPERAVSTTMKPQVIKKTGGAKVGFSIKGYINESSSQVQQQQSVSEQTPASAENQNAYCRKISQTDLDIEWRLYANMLPKEQNALKGRMMNMTPVLVEPELFEVEVENEMVLQMLGECKDNILGFMRQQLQNFRIDMRVKVAEREDVRFAISPKEKLNELLALNDELKDFIDRLGLELN